MRVRRLAGLLCLGLLAACTSSAAPPARTPAPATPSASPTPTVQPKLALERLASFSSPVWAGPAPGDTEHLYLVEKSGRVLQLDADGRQQSVVLDLSKQVSRGNEQGLLSMAFDPAFATNSRLYVDWTDRDGTTRVEAYTMAGGVATRPEPLLTVPQPYPNHNGGLLLFDPTGMLLVGLGDGGDVGDPGNRAQDLTSDLGKVLRIDPVTGEAAKDNPYPESPKVWALGLRNPWRFSFAPNGDLYVGDVGQSKYEELNVVRPSDQRGANYGWSVYEGNDRFKPDKQFSTPAAPLITPALTYLHTEGGCSITGGQVYTGRSIRWLVGSYVFADYCVGRLWSVDRTETGVTPLRDLQVGVDGPQAFGTDLQGELLVMSSEALFRLVPA